MITKQQALEFMYNLSNSFSISMDLTKGIDCYLNVYSDSCGTFGVEGDFNSLEEAVTEFIKRFGNTALLEDLKCLIPVDISMLKVGQTYEIEYDNYGEIDKIVDRLTKITIDEHRNNCRTLHFDRYCPIQEGLIIEIYKVSKCK